ncbi:MAG TPA: HlyD family efflux transporter periplasmic adaptor subunit [Sandaracinaceae bacterium LLY-WYZ-13_1]|nr:HlyD family efflux transporter periplasmic adaptor subunit [Sandaracinaceae bacterium LLY-WYZ-13_1]
MKRVVIAVVVLAVALTAAIAWKIHAQNEALEGPPRGSGVVEGEGVDLAARLGARVTAVPVVEGSAIGAGDVILELECAEPEARLAEAEARLEAARAQAGGARSQAEAARRQSQAARVSVGAARAQASALGAQRDVAAREAERVESMGEHAAVSQRDQARTAATGMEAQAEAARAQQAASRRRAAAASSQAEAATRQADAADRNVAAVEARVRTARIAVDECRVVAPREGIVERVYYEPGELVMPGAVVARVVDPAFVRATFYLPNTDVDRARVGMDARVEADAYAGRTFDGHVRRVGLEAEFTPRNIQTRSDRDRLVYPVEIRIPNPEGLLRPGMPVTVTLPSAERGERGEEG